MNQYEDLKIVPEPPSTAAAHCQYHPGSLLHLTGLLNFLRLRRESEGGHS